MTIGRKETKSLKEIKTGYPILIEREKEARQAFLSLLISHILETVTFLTSLLK